jgi:hypothetical protein
VERAIAAASQAYDELTATGHQIHFGIEQDARKVAVELRDLRGNPLSTLSPNDALQIASEWLH